MTPMKPMAPMKGMEPMKPMAPMAPPDKSWWPEGLDHPSSSGMQDGMRYAFFPDQQRLVIERGGQVEQYDTGHHRISGVSQASGHAGGSARFSSQDGEIDLAALDKVG